MSFALKAIKLNCSIGKMVKSGTIKSQFLVIMLKEYAHELPFGLRGNPVCGNNRIMALNLEVPQEE